MKFRIFSSGYCLDREFDKFLSKYPVLEKYGLEIEEFDQRRKRYVTVTDENGMEMRQMMPYTFHVKRANVTIDTLEQLMDIIKDVGHSVVVNEDSIEIYDGYRE